MSHDRRADAGPRELQREEGPANTRSAPAVRSTSLPPVRSGMKTGVGDELHGLVAQRPNRSDRLGCTRTGSGVDDEHAFAADLHDDVAARRRRACRRCRERAGCESRRPSVPSASPCSSPADCVTDARATGRPSPRPAWTRSRAGCSRRRRDAALRRELVLGPVLLDERVLTEQIARHVIRCPAEDLLAVVAGKQPVLMIGGLTVEVGGRDQWLLEIDRIGDDHRVRQPIAVADEELDCSVAWSLSGTPFRANQPCFRCVVRTSSALPTNRPVENPIHECGA